MKIKVAVLFGGKSVEHEVSIISALQAIESIDKDKYQVIPIYITKENDFYYGKGIGNIEEYKNIKNLLAKSSQITFVNSGGKHYIAKASKGFFGKTLIESVDVAFPITHGTNVEDGALQGYLKTLSIPFVGCDVLSSAIGMDKFVMKVMLKHGGIPVLDALRFISTDYENPKEVIKQIEKAFGYPVIVKPVNLGSSVGISKAKDKESLEEALDLAFKFADTVLVERAVENLREINCSVVGDKFEAEASVLEEPVMSKEILSYKDKYMSEGSKKSGGGMASLSRIIPAKLDKKTTQKIQEIAVSSFQYLGCAGVCRIDFLIDNKTGEIFFNEINTIPGSLSFYLWDKTNVKYKDLLSRLINLALKRQRAEENVTYSFETNILDKTSFKGGVKGSKGCKC